MRRIGEPFDIDAGHDDSIVIKEIQRTGAYEPEILAVMDLFLRAGDAFIDVGANFGWHTLHAARTLGPNGKVFAFEPVPEVADLLARNCQRNGFENVEIHRVALGASSGVVKLALNSENPGVGQIAEHGTLSVSMFALDQVLVGVRPKMIKIDVEGYELEVLRGAHEILDSEPVLVVEYNRGPNRERLFRFLTQRGYSLYIVSEHLQFFWVRMPFIATDFDNIVAIPKRFAGAVSPATARDYPHLRYWLRYGWPRSIALWLSRSLGLRRS